MRGVPEQFGSVVAASAQWLLAAFPPCGGALASALAEVQARQACLVAGWLRYPTESDADLVVLVGPGGSGRLDWAVGADLPRATAAEPWRSWVDEVMTSWAAALLADPVLAAHAAAVIAEGTDSPRVPVDLRRLIAPDADEVRAGALLRHPDFLEPVAALHRPSLLERILPAAARPGP